MSVAWAVVGSGEGELVSGVGACGTAVSVADGSAAASVGSSVSWDSTVAGAVSEGSVDTTAVPS